eukprot:jgi/Botrbrau1/16533/Bobra.0327s0002.1
MRVGSGCGWPPDWAGEGVALRISRASFHGLHRVPLFTRNSACSGTCPGALPAQVQIFRVGFIRIHVQSMMLFEMYSHMLIFGRRRQAKYCMGAALSTYVAHIHRMFAECMQKLYSSLYSMRPGSRAEAETGKF